MIVSHAYLGDKNTVVYQTEKKIDGEYDPCEYSQLLSSLVIDLKVKIAF